MGDKTPATTTQFNSGTSTSNPWSEATPLLKSMINKVGGLNTDPSSGQVGAYGNVIDTLKNLPGYGDQAGAAIGSMFGNSGMLNRSYDTLNKNLGSMASGAERNPYDTPGFSDAISTMSDDILKNVKGVYAGSGRNPSGAGAFGQVASRGLAQGLAPVIQSQYNTNTGNMLNANNTLYNAGNTTVGGLNSNTMQALQAAGMLPGVATSGGNALINAETGLKEIPNVGLMRQLQAAGLLGGMGGTTTTNSNSTGTQTPANDPMANWIGGLSTAGGLAGSFMSDERTKENIEEVGKLHDGQPVYRFNFKGPDKRKQIGLMAQDVEKRRPEAVREHGGVKFVDYGAATRFAGAGMHRRVA